ncbi:Hsp20/alpha crystallin family protein [Falsiroseomonas sp. HW251]|uniref:Hsp20/alpha crystallin family protein n=1 Tax=Falsiroseomonas sp. HW251 TaxID=3390998 RepID=UPI003D31A68E
MSSSLQPSDRSAGRVDRRFLGDPMFAFQRLFDDVFRGFSMPALAGATGAGLGSLMMPQMDVRETENELRIAVEMPGVSPDDVEIQIDDDLLTIRGEKKLERRDDRENMHFTERAYGTFQRILRLPFKVDPAQVQARFDNGVLAVTLPKPKGREASRRISVQSGTQQQSGNGGEAQRNGGQRADQGGATPTGGG